MAAASDKRDAPVGFALSWNILGQDRFCESSILTKIMGCKGLEWFDAAPTRNYFLEDKLFFLHSPCFAVCAAYWETTENLRIVFKRWAQVIHTRRQVRLRSDHVEMRREMQATLTALTLVRRWQREEFAIGQTKALLTPIMAAWTRFVGSSSSTSLESMPGLVSSSSSSAPPTRSDTHSTSSETSSDDQGDKGWWYRIGHDRRSRTEPASAHGTFDPTVTSPRKCVKKK